MAYYHTARKIESVTISVPPSIQFANAGTYKAFAEDTVLTLYIGQGATLTEVLYDILPTSEQFNVKDGQGGIYKTLTKSLLSMGFVKSSGDALYFNFTYTYGASNTQDTLIIEIPYQIYTITNLNGIKCNRETYTKGTTLKKSFFASSVIPLTIVSTVETNDPLKPIINIASGDFDMIYNGEVVEDDEVTLTNSIERVTIRLKSGLDLTKYLNSSIKLEKEVELTVVDVYYQLDGEITSIEPINDIELNVGDNNLGDLLSKRLVVRTENEEISPLLAQLTLYNFIASVDDESFEPNTQITEQNIEDYSFKFVRTDTYNGKANLDITFTYTDTSDSTNKTFTFTLPISVNGFVRAVATPLNKYVEENTILNGTLFNVVAYDGYGKQYILSEVEQIPHINAENNYLIVDGGNTLSKGVNTIYFRVFDDNMVSPLQTTFGTSCELYVYETAISDLRTTDTETNYKVSQAFSYDDFKVEEKHEVSSSIAYWLLINDFNCNIDNGHIFSQSDIGQQVVFISKNGVYTSYTIQVEELTTQEIWTFNKKTFAKSIYGEYEQEHNISLTLDQNKDSSKIIVWNFVGEELEPNTIVYLPDTDTWWIVKSDTSSRYDSEDSNGYWKHEIELVGAFDILLARDMVNHGYNKDRYTLETMLNRLISMTDFELPVSFDFRYFNKDTKIGYIKAFENYAPSTALKEIFNGINAIPKMRFTIGTDNKLKTAIIDIIPKSGINERVDIGYFDNVEEVRTSEKSNFGTKVVSNIRNCVNSDIVRYPNTGASLLLGEGSYVTPENAYIQLPNKVDSIDRIELHGRYRINGEVNGDTLVRREYLSKGDLFNDDEVRKSVDEICNLMEIDSLTNIDAIKQRIYDYVKLNAYITIMNNSSIETRKYNGTHNMRFYFGDKQTYDTHETQKHFAYWEQGSDKIKNFTWFTDALHNYLNKFDPDLTFDMLVKGQIEFNVNDLLTEEELEQNRIYFYIKPLADVGLVNSPLEFVVYYRPQVNLKLKVDNDRVGNDTQLYNQNGKLVDSVAVSKLINSHAQDISSSNITRYKTTNNFFELPKLGTIVNVNGEDYIINNISYDFSQYEHGYRVDAEFSFTKAVACKSTMISANNNIRDYECPQNYNIDREQLYRDYFELSYERENIESSYNTHIDGLFDFGFTNYGIVHNYNCLIKVRNSNYDDNLYFRKETTAFALDKSIVVVCDFGDNNIIGYSKAKGSQFEFDIWKLFETDKLYNIPISYVDSKGELDSISLLLVNNEEYSNATYDYLSSSDKDKIAYFGFTPVIPEQLYEYCENNGYSAKIVESEYKKDGLEKPKFEYMAQFGDTNDIVIGYEIFKGIKASSTEFYEYQFVISDNRITNENIPNSADIISSIELATQKIHYLIENKAKVVYDKNEQKFVITLYDDYDIDNDGIEQGGSRHSGSLLGTNIAIIRKTQTRGLASKKTEEKLIFAINNCKKEFASGVITLYLNNYKLN